MEVRAEEALLPRPPFDGGGDPTGTEEVVGRAAQRCIRGERECNFSSPLSSNAKCLLCMHGLLENILVMQCVRRCINGFAYFCWSQAKGFNFASIVAKSLYFQCCVFLLYVGGLGKG